MDTKAPTITMPSTTAVVPPSTQEVPTQAPTITIPETTEVAPPSSVSYFWEMLLTYILCSSNFTFPILSWYYIKTAVEDSTTENIFDAVSVGMFYAAVLMMTILFVLRGLRKDREAKRARYRDLEIAGAGGGEGESKNRGGWLVRVMRRLLGRKEVEDKSVKGIKMDRIRGIVGGRWGFSV